MGQNASQRVQNWLNKNQVAPDLLRASTSSVIRAVEGIHQLCHPTYWENPHEYISYRWQIFKYNCTFRTPSLQPPSSWNPCSYHLPQGTSLEFWPLKKGMCEMWKWYERLFNGMGSKGNPPMHAGTTSFLFPSCHEEKEWQFCTPCAENDKKNVHEELYFRSLSVSNNWPSQARSEAHKAILNLPNHHKSESLDTKISIQSVTRIQRSRIIARDEWWFS